MKNYREKCYQCYRPKSSCMCKHIKKIPTNTEFIILMHPKEFQKTKNGTGHFTHLSLSNSKLFIGIDFSQHPYINETIQNKHNNCFILYPSENAIELNSTNIQKDNKKNIIFIIDSTWACSKKILKKSTNLSHLPSVSFIHQEISNFKIKKQPNIHCLSTIESTLCVLELLNLHKIEHINKSSLCEFLKPFEKMVQYQLGCANDLKKQSLRYKNISE